MISKTSQLDSTVFHILLLVDHDIPEPLDINVSLHHVCRRLARPEHAVRGGGVATVLRGGAAPVPVEDHHLGPRPAGVVVGPALLPGRPQVLDTRLVVKPAIM